MEHRSIDAGKDGRVEGGGVGPRQDNDGGVKVLGKRLAGSLILLYASHGVTYVLALLEQVCHHAQGDAENCRTTARVTTVSTKVKPPSARCGTAPCGSDRQTTGSWTCTLCGTRAASHPTLTAIGEVDGVVHGADMTLELEHTPLGRIQTYRFIETFPVPAA